MNEPYAPQPGYYNQPGYPPPPRQGIGCFAKGCITVIIVLMLLGVGLGAAGWYLARNITTFVGPTPVPIRTYQATPEQYQEVIGRYTAFIQALNAGQAATFTLSGDDLNTLIARDPEFKNVRGKLYMTIDKDEIVAESSFPIPQDSRFGHRTTNAYFNGRMRFAASYSGGELSLFIRRIESLKGDAMSDGLLSMLNKADLGQGFNETMRDARREGEPWAEAMSKVDKIVVQDGHIVATALAGAPATNPIPLPGQSPSPKADPDDSPSGSE